MIPRFLFIVVQGKRFFNDREVIRLEIAAALMFLHKCDIRINMETFSVRCLLLFQSQINSSFLPFIISINITTLNWEVTWGERFNLWTDFRIPREEIIQDVSSILSGIFRVDLWSLRMEKSSYERVISKAWFQVYRGG